MKVSGMYLEGVWNVSGRCLEENWSLTLLLCGLVTNYYYNDLEEKERINTISFTCKKARFDRVRIP